MKRLAFFLALILSFSCIFSNVFAETQMTLTSTTMTEDGVITIKGKITEPSAYQKYTAVVVKYKEENIYTVSDAIYIGQKESADVTVNNGNFTFTFKGNIEDDEKYIVRIGGTNIAEPSSSEVIRGEAPDDPVTPTPTPSTEVYGDVNNDKVVDFEDASILMQFVLDKNGVTNVTIDDDFFKRANVTGKKEITAEQVANIVQKALDSSFIFPVQKNK